MARPRTLTRQAVEAAAPERGAGLDDPSARNGVAPETVGRRVREERLRQQIGVRELARRVGVSASLISQVELGKASPSVGTLYSIVNQLGLSLDELLLGSTDRRRRLDAPAGDGHRRRPATPEPDPPDEIPGGTFDPVVRRGAGKAIELASGVRWERLTPQTPQDVDFLNVVYEEGGESCPEDSLMRHSGSEYGHVLTGRLGVTVGFDTYELGAGDSISFESTMPHRLFNLGSEPVEAIWFVVGRRGDPRIVRNQD
jgi:transcriptional regulator with XRE-family HTH domain/mannose-6-phosphate isomerase-like protein (cupin superfamily)